MSTRDTPPKKAPRKNAEAGKPASGRPMRAKASPVRAAPARPARPQTQAASTSVPVGNLPSSSPSAMTGPDAAARPGAAPKANARPTPKAGPKPTAGGEPAAGATPEARPEPAPGAKATPITPGAKAKSRPKPKGGPKLRARPKPAARATPQSAPRVFTRSVTDVGPDSTFIIDLPSAEPYAAVAARPTETRTTTDSLTLEPTTDAAAPYQPRAATGGLPAIHVAAARPAAPPTPRPLPSPATTAPTSRLRATATSLVWLLPTLVVAALVNVVSLLQVAPRTIDETTYTAQAWALGALGEMAGFSLLDHPPLGWLQIAAYAQLTGAFDRWDLAVVAGREAMIVFTLASVVLLWLLARRLRFSHGAATAAALIFAVAPLGVVLHGIVSLDNVGTAWVLLAFFLATNRRRQLAAFAGSAAAFSVAVLSKETFLVALPILIWVMVRSSRRDARLSPLSAAGATVLTILGAYAVVSSLYGAQFPGGPLSGTDALPFTLGATGRAAPLTGWWQLDAALLAVAAVASLAGLFVHRTRPYAVLTLAVGALLAVPVGILPLTFVTVAIPFAALVIAGVVDAAVVVVRRRGVRRSAAPIAVVTAIAAGALIAVPLWTVQLSGLLWDAPADPLRDAQAWLTDNADTDQPLVVDESMRLDLVRAGWADDSLMGYRAIATGGASAADLPVGWQGADFAVAPASARQLADSPVVAAFGDGANAIEVRQIIGATDAAPAGEAESLALRRELGEQLAENPAIVLWSTDRALLVDGRVDERIIDVLGALSASGDVEIAGFPMVDGEQDLALRTVALLAIDGEALVYGGRPTLRGETLIASLAGAYAPDDASIDGNRLVLRFPHSAGASVE